MSHLSGKFVASLSVLKTKLLEALLGTKSYECGRWAWKLCAYLLFPTENVFNNVYVWHFEPSQPTKLLISKLLQALLAFPSFACFSAFRKHLPVD